MTSSDGAREALEAYSLSGPATLVRQLEATHVAFQVQAGERLYALRQFNPYITAEALTEQFRLARLMCEIGLNVSVPVCASDGSAFVEVADGFWALFPWCDGRPGQRDRIDDLRVLAAMQGKWIACAERLSSRPEWEGIERVASEFRRRKSWAWVVPLDQLPRFAREQQVIERARQEAPGGPHRQAFLDLLPEVDSRIREFDGLLRENGVHDLPHTVTHGDFWASNICISEDGAVVLDLDCFSFEPRIADFARAANWFHTDTTPQENASLLRQFQGQARLSEEELRALPLMMCAHDLYYAVGHVLLFLTEDAASQAHLIGQIESEVKAADRFEREGEEIMSMFLTGT